MLMMMMMLITPTHTFNVRGVAENASLITKAFTADLVIPEFTTFCSTINDIFNRCKSNDGGKVSEPHSDNLDI